MTPLTLLVHPGTGQIRQLRTTEVDYARRDVEVQLWFSRWSDGSVPFPGQVFKVDGLLMTTEVRSATELNPVFGTTFDPPSGATFGTDQPEEDRGALHGQLHLGIANAGIDLDKPALDVSATRLQDDGGTDLPMWYVTGADTRHHSLIVEQTDGVVLCDAPVRPERGQAILDWIDANIGKPVTHLVVSHHHIDHAGGVRGGAADGATVVVFEDTAEHFRRILSAPSTVRPDALATVGPVAVPLLTVPRLGSLTLADASAPLEIFHVPTPHADDMVMPVALDTATGSSVAFVADIWNPFPLNGLRDRPLDTADKEPAPFGL